MEAIQGAFLFLRGFVDKKTTLKQRWNMIQVICLITYAAAVHHKYACDNEAKAAILCARIQAFTQQKIDGNSFNDGRDTIPHPIDIHDVPALESLDEEVDDTGISDETASHILLLAAASKEFKLRISENFCYTE